MWLVLGSGSLWARPWCRTWGGEWCRHSPSLFSLRAAGSCRTVTTFLIHFLLHSDLVPPWETCSSMAAPPLSCLSLPCSGWHGFKSVGPAQLLASSQAPGLSAPGRSEVTAASPLTEQQSSASQGTLSTCMLKLTVGGSDRVGLQVQRGGGPGKTL